MQDMAYAGGVKRTTVMLPDELDASLRLEARRRRVPVAVLIREALEARYGPTERPRKLSFVDLPVEPGYPGLPPDASSRVDELLAEMLNKEYEKDQAEHRRGR